MPLRCAGKKMQAPLLGLAKSIYYHNMLLDQLLAQVFVHQNRGHEIHTLADFSFHLKAFEIMYI